MSWGVRDGMIFFGMLIKNNHMATQTTAAPKVAKDSKLREFFIEQLQDIYWAEQKLVKTLPKMAEAAHSKELRKAFESHLRRPRIAGFICSAYPIKWCW